MQGSLLENYEEFQDNNRLHRSHSCDAGPICDSGRAASHHLTSLSRRWFQITQGWSFIIPHDLGTSTRILPEKPYIMKQGERELLYLRMSCLLNKYLLGSHYVPDPVLQVGDTMVSKTCTDSLSLYIAMFRQTTEMNYQLGQMQNKTVSGDAVSRNNRGGHIYTIPVL